MADAGRDANRTTNQLVKSNANNDLIELLADSITSRLLVNATITGSISVAGMISESYDFVSLAQTATEDIYVFKDGGSSGTTVATITMTFTDSGKETISTVERT